MKKTLMIICTTAMTFAFANEPVVEQTAPVVEQKATDVTQGYGFFSLGLGPMPIPLPAFGIGYRAQQGHFGSELSLQATTLVYAAQLKGNFLLHYYPKPNFASQFYVGTGISPSAVFGNGKSAFAISPELVLGQQYRNASSDPRFIQAQISFPTLAIAGHKHRAYLLGMPLVVLSYGIGF